MIKKISIYLILILFSTNVVAQDLIMKCGEYTYKYISDPSGDKVLFKHPKGTKNKYKEWCKKEATKPALSREGWVRIIKDNKATCMVKKTVYPNNIERTNSVSVSDFAQLTRHIEWYHTKSGDKKNVRDYKCKKRKK